MLTFAGLAGASAAAAEIVDVEGTEGEIATLFGGAILIGGR